MVLALNFVSSAICLNDLLGFRRFFSLTVLTLEADLFDRGLPDLSRSLKSPLSLYRLIVFQTVDLATQRFLEMTALLFPARWSDSIASLLLSINFIKLLNWLKT